MKTPSLKQAIAVGGLAVAATFVAPQPAPADTASTAAIVAAAAAIVGALFVDANQQPYYVKDNRRYYVSQPEATYYRTHYHAVQRQAWVPEQRYPIARRYPGNNGNRNGNNGNHNGNNGNHTATTVITKRLGREAGAEGADLTP